MYKGKRGTDLPDLSLNRSLDDAAVQQDANRVSCQVTVVVVVVTDIDDPSTMSEFPSIIILVILNKPLMFSNPEILEYFQMAAS